jgi:hypothetical protein
LFSLFIFSSGPIRVLSLSVYIASLVAL